MDPAKLDALGEFRTSPLFGDSERAALAFASELTEDRHVGRDTFAELARHYSEREICEIVFLVASEHLYNINVAYWHVADIEAKLAELTTAGAMVKDTPRDVGGGRLVATVSDPNGNVLGLIQDREEPRNG